MADAGHGKYGAAFSERMAGLITSLMVPAVIAYLFYRSIAAFVVLLPLAGYVGRRRRAESERKRKHELNLEFREAVISVQTALNAGYSVENAFIEAGRDMENMYGPEAMITVEFKSLERRLKTNENLENIIYDMAERSGLDDIKDFADVFSAAKRSGGDLTKIIRRTSDTISDKIEVRREIETLVSAKRMENRIMQAVPFGIIAYLNMTSAGFLSSLYHNPTGVVVMSFCLALYAGGFCLSERITDIEI